MIRLGLLVLGVWAAARSVGKSRHRLAKQRESEQLDEALDETFPASDAPATTVPGSFIGGDAPDEEHGRPVH